MRRERRLVSLRRRVEEGRRPRYRELWEELHREATARGAHAWWFVSADPPQLFLEFLEFEAGSDPRSTPEVRSVLHRLEAEAGAADVEEWHEAARG